MNLNPFSPLSDEYERAVATVNQLTQQIEDLKEATRDDSETVDTLKRKLETSLRDNDRMSKQNKDLGKIIDLLSSSWSNMGTLGLKEFSHFLQT